MRIVEIVFASVFFVTAILVLTFKGYEQDPMDWIAFACSAFGIPTSQWLAARMRSHRHGPLMVASVLSVLAILPVRVAIEIVSDGALSWTIWRTMIWTVGSGLLVTGVLLFAMHRYVAGQKQEQSSQSDTNADDDHTQ